MSQEMFENGMDEAEYGSDDETLGDLLDQCSSAPASWEKCLALNLVYQELLQKKISQVEDRWNENEQKSFALKAERERSLLANYVTKEFVRVPVLQYIPPYFRDSIGMAPKPNIDAQLKKERNELNILVEPAKKWNKVEKAKLMDAVYVTLLDIELKSLINKRNVTIDQLKTAIPDEHEKLTKEIEDLNKSIEKTKNNSKLETVPKELYQFIDWAKIAATDMKGTRTEMECRLAYTNMFDPKLNQNKHWSDDELNRLRELVMEHNGHHWAAVAEKLGTRRTAFQCFEKYQSELNESIIKKEWTDEDDNKLIETVKDRRIGSYICWEIVAGMMEGRTRARCQMRWFRKLDPNLKSGRWSDDEDAALVAAVQKYGDKGWRKIALDVAGRTEAQCRERWNSALKGDLKTGPWTEGEDQLLFDGVRIYGVGKWSKISTMISGRTASACKIRYRTLEKVRKP